MIFHGNLTTTRELKNQVLWSVMQKHFKVMGAISDSFEKRFCWACTVNQVGYKNLGKFIAI